MALARRISGTLSNLSSLLSECTIGVIRNCGAEVVQRLRAPLSDLILSVVNRVNQIEKQ